MQRGAARRIAAVLAEDGLIHADLELPASVSSIHDMELEERGKGESGWPEHNRDKSKRGEEEVLGMDSQGFYLAITAHRYAYISKRKKRHLPEHMPTQIVDEGLLGQKTSSVFT
jgi:hypothetical protein